MYIQLWVEFLQTGSTDTPAIRSSTGAIAGCESTGPMTGMDRSNWRITPKKSPNSPIIPSDSTMNPTKVHLHRIMKMPTTRKMVPRLLVGLVKNLTVFCGPIISSTPSRNKMFPTAKSALSKKVKIPKRKNRHPPNVNTAPNSARKRDWSSTARHRTRSQVSSGRFDLQKMHC